MESNVNIEILAKQEKRRYYAEWRKANKDKVRASNVRYWAKRALERTEREGKNDE